MPVTIRLPDGDEIDIDTDDPKAAATAAQKVWASRAGGHSQVPTYGEGLHDANTGLGQGLTAGFYDEISSGIAAPFRAVARKVQEGDWQAPGLSDLSGAYNTELGQRRAQLHQAEERSPIATAAGNVAGAVMLPMTGGVGAASLPTRAAIGAGEGAAYGAAYGFGSGEGEEDRLRGMAVGGAAGAVAGGALPLVAAGGSALAKSALEPLRGLFGTENAAAHQVRQAILEDAPRLSPQQFSQARNRGQPVANIDIGGERTRSLARTAADLSPEARESLDRVINDRFESQGDRVSGFMRTLVPGTDAAATTETLQAAARKFNKPAYAKAYTDGDQSIWSPELQRLAGSPDVLAAMKSASRTGKSRAISDGFGGFRNGVEITPSGQVKFLGGRNGPPTYPNLQFWDYTQRVLSDEASAAARTGRKEMAQRIGTQARMLKEELDKAVPSFKQARAGAAAFFGAEEAVEAGANFAKQNFKVPETRRALSKMSAPERELFRQGFVSHILDVAGGTRYRADLVSRIWGSPQSREKISIALGPSRAGAFEAFMNIEAAMNLPRTAIQGNSRTAQYLAAMGMSGTITGLSTGDWKSALYAAIIGGGVRLGLKGVDRRVAESVGKMLASDDPKVFMRGVNLVSKNKAMMAAFRQAIGESAGPVVGQQASEVE
jgi:hypothetical protein